MFLSQSKRQTLLCLWHALSRDGIVPHKGIEQLSYLLVLKLLEMDAPDDSLAFLPSSVRWSTLRAMPEERLLPAVDEAMAWLRSSDLSDSQLFHSAAVLFSKSSLLREVMALLDELFFPSQPREIRAHIYNALLSMAEKEAARWAAPGGKYYTSSHLAYLLCSLVCPQPGERICDFACGSGRLLASAYLHITRTWSDPDQLHYAADGQPLPLEDRQWSPEQSELLRRTQLVGFDIDSSAALQAWVLLRCLGSKRPSIFAQDALSRQLQQRLPGTATGQGLVDLLLGNPPYGSMVDTEDLAEDLRALGTKKAELLFLKLAFRLLRPGGRAAMIVPDTILFNKDTATVALREALVQDHCLHAIISLPKGAFSPFTNVKTSILVWTHSGETKEIWWYSVESDGYTLDKHRRPTPECNDLPDLLVKYSLRFARDLASCRPSAFIDADTALQWENIEPERQAYHYAQPVVVQRQQSIGGESQAILCFNKTLAVPVREPRAWEARVDQLAHPLILLPGWYQPDGGLPAFAKNQRPGYPPGYPASHVPGTRGTPRPPFSPDAMGATQGSEQREGLTLYYLPGVKDLSSLDGWYTATLRGLYQLHVREDLATQRLLPLLRLLHAIYQRQHAAYHADPPEDDDTPLTPVDVMEANDILPWYRGAIRTLHKRKTQGRLSQEGLQASLLVLSRVKEQLERQYGRVWYSPLPARVALSQ